MRRFCWFRAEVDSQRAIFQSVIGRTADRNVYRVEGPIDCFVALVHPTVSTQVRRERFLRFVSGSAGRYGDSDNGYLGFQPKYLVLLYLPTSLAEQQQESPSGNAGFLTPTRTSNSHGVPRSRLSR